MRVQLEESGNMTGIYMGTSEELAKLRHENMELDQALQDLHS